MKRLIKALIPVLLLQLGTGLFAQSKFPDLIPEVARKKALSTGFYRVINPEGDMDFHVLPECEYTERIKSNRVKKTGMSFVAEQVYILKKSELKKTKEYPNGNPDIHDVAEIFTTMTKLNEVIYYSNTRHKNMLLYKDVCFVESLENPVALPDPVLRETDGLKKVFHSKDASFGLNTYSMDYYQSENALYATASNLDPMGLAGMEAVVPGDLIIHYLIIDCGDNFVLYLGADINSKKLPGMRKKISTSFDARLTGVCNWFAEQF